MQSAGPGLQLLIYYGASRQERERQPGGVLQGPGPGTNTVSDKSINTVDLQAHRAALLPKAPPTTLTGTATPPFCFPSNSLFQRQAFWAAGT